MISKASISLLVTPPKKGLPIRTMKIVTKKKRLKKHKVLSTISKTVDTFIVSATTSSSVTLSLTGLGLIVIPIFTEIARGLTVTNNTLNKIIMNEFNKHKKVM